MKPFVAWTVAKLTVTLLFAVGLIVLKFKDLHEEMVILSAVLHVTIATTAETFMSHEGGDVPVHPEAIAGRGLLFIVVQEARHVIVDVVAVLFADDHRHSVEVPFADAHLLLAEVLFADDHRHSVVVPFVVAQLVALELLPLPLLV